MRLTYDSPFTHLGDSPIGEFPSFPMRADIFFNFYFYFIFYIYELVLLFYSLVVNDKNKSWAEGVAPGSSFPKRADILLNFYISIIFFSYELVLFFICRV